jgi:WD40 repeat protein
MIQVVVLRLSGDLDKGFQSVLEIGQESSHPALEITGSLPPNLELHQKYKQYQVSYRSLDGRNRGLREREGAIENVSIQRLRQTCNASLEQLNAAFNTWLKAETFRDIRDALLIHLQPSDEIRIMIRSNYRAVQQLPWNVWDVMKQFPKAEISMSASDYAIRPVAKVPTWREKVRILAILGNRTGIDIDTDVKLLKQLPDTELTFLVEPNSQQISDQLWEQPWDVLFFAGHSQTEGEAGRLYINKTESLTISDLRYGLRKAIERGLQLAIFNSCDGLGLAWELEDLQIPQVIVMREPVPDAVAQSFLKYFLKAFSSGLGIDLAMREARERLHDSGSSNGTRLEALSPGVSFLPLIYQNAASSSLTWQRLGHRSTNACPYRGLFAFQEKDAPFFFGREAFTHQLLDAVQTEALVTIIGSSGSGKSSTVFAGLIPELRKSNNWCISQFRPGDRPFHALANSLISYLEPNLTSQNDLLKETRKLAATFQQEPEALRDVIEQIVGKQNPTNLRMLLVVDQFEELYTLCSKQTCQDFLDQLLAVVRTVDYHDPHFTLVLTIRADFLGYALSDRAFADVISKADLMLGPMHPDELERAIIQPAELLGVSIEDGLTKRILNDVNPSGMRIEPGVLPLIEFTLTQLWSRQHNARLTHAAYDQIGGVKEAIAHYAEDVYERLNEEEKERVRRIFIQLIHPGVETPDTRRIATRKDIGEENWRLIVHLANVRLVTTSQTLVLGNDGKLTEEETVELVHEALINEWFRLKTWLELDREFRTWQDRLRALIADWKRSDQDSNGLLRGRVLVEAENWLKERRIELTPAEQDFIGRSIELRNKRKKLTIFGLSTVFTVVSTAAGVALLSRQQAVTALGEQIMALGRSSNVLRVSGQPFDALLSAIRAGKPILAKQVEVTPQSATWTQVQGALQQALFQVREQNRLESHTDEVWSVSFSPDQQYIATGSADGTAKLWNRQGKELKTLEGHKSIVASVAFSLDSQLVATASFDKTVKLWNRDGKLLTTLKNHTGWVYSVAFSPDGKTIASASKDGTVKLWSLEGKLLDEFKVPAPADKGDGGLNTVAFSPDGQKIAASSWDKTVRVWDLKDKHEQVLAGHQDGVNSVSFSPDGKWIVTASRDRTIKLWNRDGQEIRTLKGHTDEVGNASFSPDGSTIVSAGFDKTVRLWHLDGEELKPFLAGHTAQVNQAVFSPDGSTIATAGFDKTAKLWSYRPQSFLRLKGHNDNVWGVSFSPDGSTIATASQDNTVQLWNRNGQKVPQTFPAHSDTVTSVTFSPDGKTIATTSKDDRVRIISLDGTVLRTLGGFEQSDSNQVDSLSFSPDGTIVVAVDWTGMIKAWNRDGQEILSLRGHDDRIYDISFSPKGQMFATASKDKTVKLWSLDGKLLQVLKGHSDQVFNVDFSANGQTILTSSRDGTIKLWNLAGQITQSIDVSSIYPGQVYSARFSPNSQLIAAATRDGRLTLWNVKGNLLKILDGHTDIADSVSFSPDGTEIASASRDDTAIVWKLDLQSLKQSEQLWLLDLNASVQNGCKWVKDYLQNNASLSESDRRLCD